MNNLNTAPLGKRETAGAELRIRRAEAHEAPAIRALHELALSVLSSHVYTPEMVQRLFASFDTAPQDMIDAGRLLVAERHGFLVGTAGWEPRVKNGQVSAHLRSVFVHPLQTRRGVASALIGAAEEDARGFPGVAILTLAATLNAVPLYEALGYRPERAGSIDLGAGLLFPVVFMMRDLERQLRSA